MTDAYSSDKRRLWNWGRWARLNPDAPDATCANPLYDMMIERAEGWGDDGDVQVRTQEAGAELPEIDEADAESLDCWIRQLPMHHRANLNRRYVLRLEVLRECVEAAIRAIWDLQERNRESNRDMERRLRGA